MKRWICIAQSRGNYLKAAVSLSIRASKIIIALLFMPFDIR
jgi:hypothetical protein